MPRRSSSRAKAAEDPNVEKRVTRRSLRGAAEPEPPKEVAKAAKSPAPSPRGRGRSRGRGGAQRSGRGAAEEEPEDKDTAQETAEAELESSQDSETKEEATPLSPPKSTSRSRGRSRGRGKGRVVKSKPPTEEAEEEPEVKEVEKSPARPRRSRSAQNTPKKETPTPTRRGRRGRSSAAAEEEETPAPEPAEPENKDEEKMEEDVTESPSGSKKRKRSSVESVPKDIGKTEKKQKVEDKEEVHEKELVSEKSEPAEEAKAESEEAMETETSTNLSKEPEKPKMEESQEEKKDEEKEEKEMEEEDKACKDTEKSKDSTEEPETSTKVEEPAAKTEEAPSQPEPEAEKNASKPMESDEEADVQSKEQKRPESSQKTEPEKVESEESKPEEDPTDSKEEEVPMETTSEDVKEDKTEEVLKEYVVINMEDVPASDSAEVTKSTPPDVPEETSKPKEPEVIPEVEAAMPAEDKPDESESKDAVQPSTVPETETMEAEQPCSKPETETKVAEQPCLKPETETKVAEQPCSKPETETKVAEQPCSKPETETMEAEQPCSKPETETKGNEQPSSEPVTESNQAEKSNTEIVADTENISSHLANSTPEVNSNISNGTITNSLDSVTDALFSRKSLPNPHVTVPVEDKFSLVSYNILADCHAQKSSSQYNWTSSEKLLMDARHKRFTKELQYLNADVVCLQEVSPEYFNAVLTPTLKGCGYEGLFKKRLSCEEGEATFYRTDRFELVSHRGLSLSDLAFKELETCGLDSEKAAAVKTNINRPTVVLITQLRCKLTQRIITVGNIHISHDQLKRPDLQCIQAACAVKEVVAMADGPGNAHVLCGDFNCTPTSPVYQLMKDGYLNDGSLATLQAMTNVQLAEGQSQSLVNLWFKGFQHTSPDMRSSYSLVTGTEPVSTRYADTGDSMEADYIWCGGSNLDVASILAAVPPSLISTGIPNDVFPSDHLSQKAELFFK